MSSVSILLKVILLNQSEKESQENRNASKMGESLPGRKITINIKAKTITRTSGR
jgi:hypothetical protein